MYIFFLDVTFTYHFVRPSIRPFIMSPRKTTCFQRTNSILMPLFCLVSINILYIQNIKISTLPSPVPGNILFYPCPPALFVKPC